MALFQAELSLPSLLLGYLPPSLTSSRFSMSPEKPRARRSLAIIESKPPTHDRDEKTETQEQEGLLQEHHAFFQNLHSELCPGLRMRF